MIEYWILPILILLLTFWGLFSTIDLVRYFCRIFYIFTVILGGGLTVLVSLGGGAENPAEAVIFLILGFVLTILITSLNFFRLLIRYWLRETHEPEHTPEENKEIDPAL